MNNYYVLCQKISCSLKLGECGDISKENFILKLVLTFVFLLSFKISLLIRGKEGRESTQNAEEVRFPNTTTKLFKTTFFKKQNNSQKYQKANRDSLANSVSLLFFPLTALSLNSSDSSQSR